MMNEDSTVALTRGNVCISVCISALPGRNATALRSENPLTTRKNWKKDSLLPAAPGTAITPPRVPKVQKVEGKDVQSLLRGQSCVVLAFLER